ncbi:MAG TPA: carboxypeptidase-like regulatory domain-containing protein [Gemmata sp.]
MTTTRFAPLVALALLGLLATIRCADAADGKATGKVTVNGKPLAKGTVTFRLPNGQFVGSKIKDGKYAIDHLPAGILKVTVQGEGVPAKFGAEETTTLSIEAKNGGAFDFDLK